jgi:hypothetical protein
MKDDPTNGLSVANMWRISRVFQQFRKDACLPGDDRISESFIKAAKALMEPVDTASRQSFEAWAMDFYGCEREHVDHLAGVDGFVIWQASRGNDALAAMDSCAAKPPCRCSGLGPCEHHTDMACRRDTASQEPA